MIVVTDGTGSSPMAVRAGADGGDIRLSPGDRAELLNAMAEIYSARSAADTVLDRLGVPRSRRRSWEGQTAQQWWTYTFMDLDHGIISDPYPRIIESLVADYPTNAVARRLGSKYGLVADCAVPEPQRGGSGRPMESTSSVRSRSAENGPGRLDPASPPSRSTARRRAGRFACAAIVVLLPLPLAIVDTGDAAEPPLAAYLAVFSMFFMAAFLPSVLLPYLFRSRIDRLSRMLHPVPANRYFARLAYPTGGVIVLSVIGYQVSGMRDPDSTVSFASFLGLLLLVVGVFRAGVISLKMLAQDEQWPPTDLPADEPVPIRRAVQRIRDGLTVPVQDGSTALGVLDLLRDRTLPALYARRDRRFRTWLQENRRVKFVVGWCLFTVGLLGAAILPGIFDGKLVGIVSVLGATAGMAVWWGAIGWTSYLHARWQAAQLADQVSRETEELRARITGTAAHPADECGRASKRRLSP
jgi:hypothetical protein